MTITTRLFWPVAALSLLATSCSNLLGAAPAEVDAGNNPPEAGSQSGSGGSMSIDQGPPPVDAAREVAPAGGSGGSGGSGDAGVTGPDADAGGADAGPGMTGACAYPTAPVYTASQFKVGSVMPNLTFTRENGSPFSMKDVYCNKHNRLLYWTTGGDDCPPCVAAAKEVELPAWKEMGPSGLFVFESFNGAGFLVSDSPWVGWRRKTMWPADGEAIAVVKEPTTPPYYLQDRVNSILPWTAIVDVATMKILSASGGSSNTVASVRARLMALPPRP